MIILCAGMQKSGSKWYFSLAEDLLEQQGFPLARSLRHQYRLDLLAGLTERSTIRHPYFHRLMALAWAGRSGRRIMVKTHRGPSLSAAWLLRRGSLRVASQVRDPRDVVLSALDHGRKIREAGGSHTFASLHTFEDALRSTCLWLKRAKAWWQTPGVLRVRYEDLLAHPTQELQRLADYISLEVTDSQILSAVEKYEQKKGQAGQAKLDASAQLLHFNQGQAKRYQKEMTAEQQQRCVEMFAPYLEFFGYALDSGDAATTSSKLTITEPSDA